MDTITNGHNWQITGDADRYPGNPVGHARTIAPDRSVSDGGGANPLSGYTVISADSLDAAVALARGCPVLDGNGSVEVCETFDAM